MVPESADLPQFPGWTTIEKLGEGGMCQVFRVHNDDDGRDAAIKVLLDPDRANISRFLDEADLLMQIRHPNVLRVDHIERDARPPWIVMELLAGHDLEEGRQKGPMDPETAARLFADVANGLSAVHAKGFRHRDIKPANIMIGADGQAKLIDFGIARNITKAHVTQAGMVVGTVSYLPPEIFSGDDAQGVQDTESADVYALGQTLYEVLTGQPTHSRELSGTKMLVQIMKDKLDKDYLDPRVERPVPDGLAEAVIAATQMEPEDRVKTAAEFEQKLRDFVENRNRTESAPVSSGIDPSNMSVPAPPPPPPAPAPEPEPAQAEPARESGSAPAPLDQSPIPEPPAPNTDPRATDAIVADLALAGVPLTQTLQIQEEPVRTRGLFASAAGITMVGGGLVVFLLIGLVLLYVLRPQPQINESKAARIRQVVVNNQAKIAACATKGGRAKVRWHLDAGGKVDKVRIANSSLQDPGADKCIASAIRGMKFPGGPGSVEVPIDLRP